MKIIIYTIGVLGAKNIKFKFLGRMTFGSPCGYVKIQYRTAQILYITYQNFESIFQKIKKKLKIY